MQLRLPPTIEGSVAATGSAENAIAHINSVINTREQLHLIGLGGFAALQYSLRDEATVVGLVEHLVKLHELTRAALFAFETATNVSAQTVGSA